MNFKVNRKAPRFSKTQFSTQIFGKELWKKFKEQHPEYSEMEWKEFKQLWGDITQTIRNETVMNPLGVKLGSYLGELKCQFLPYNFKATDINASNETGEQVNHLNILTRGKVAKIKWERRMAGKYFKMLQLYAFEPHRQNNEISKDYIPNNADKIRVSRNTLGGRRTW